MPAFAATSFSLLLKSSQSPVELLLPEVPIPHHWKVRVDIRFWWLAVDKVVAGVFSLQLMWWLQMLLLVLQLCQLFEKFLLVGAVVVFAAPCLRFLLLARTATLPAEEIFSAEEP